MLHGAWAALAIITCLFLVLTKQTGHPPPIVLVPFVVVAWVVGHGILWGVQHLAARGRSLSPGAAASQAWPISLRLVLIVTGIAAMVGLLQVIGTVIQRTWYPYHDLSLWGLMLAVWLAHAACCVGLLLRRRWSRWLSAMLPIGWALVLGGQVYVQWTGVANTDTAGVTLAAGLIVLLLASAAYLAWSPEVKSFLVR